MIRIILLVISGIIAIGLSCKSLKLPSSKNPSTSDEEMEGLTPTRQRKTVGGIKTKTREEITTEQRRARAAEIKRQRELQQQKRAEERAKRKTGYGGYYGQNYSDNRRGRRQRGYTGGARTSRKTTIGTYKLTGIYTINNDNYAIIDGRSVIKGDDISDKKVIEVQKDRIIIDDNGQKREVRIGESVFPNLIVPRTRR